MDVGMLQWIELYIYIYIEPTATDEIFMNSLGLGMTWER